MKKKFFGSNSLKQLLYKVKSMMESKADKTSITDFITSQQKESADIVEGYYEDENNFATIGYIDSEIAKNCISTQYAFEIKE